MIVQGKDLDRDVHLEADAVVLGAGAGGAVAAARLAEAGWSVVVLEEGPYVQGRDFTQREEEMYPLLYRDGGAQTTADGAINVLQGRCYGGSTVINMGDCVPAPEAVLDHWERVYGVRLDREHLGRCVDRVQAALQANPVPPALINRNNRLLLEAAQRAGLDATVLNQNRVGCVGAGFCLIGCTYDAKKGAHLTYLPRADRAGARIYCDCRAERIVRRRGRAVAVRARVVDRERGEERFELTVRADLFVVACGALHSPLLLLRSGIARTSRALANNLTLQPQAPVVALFDEEIDFFRGIPQSAAVTAWDEATPEGGLGGFRLEGVSGGPGMGAGLIGGFGGDHKRLMAKFHRFAACLVLVPDRPSGWVRPGRAWRPKVRYRFADDTKKRLGDGLRQAARLYLEAGARQVGLPSEDLPAIRGPSRLDEVAALARRPERLHLISAHPQGTCRMGRDPKTSVVDPACRCHDMPNVLVTDASIFPSSASTHTMVPIMAFTEYALDRLLAGGAG